MVVKAIALLRAKQGLSRAEFVQYYENNHVPLMLGLMEGVLDYRRNYIDFGAMMSGPDGAHPDYDSITEIWFTDRAAYDRAMAVMSDPEKAQTVATDEEKFLDRAATRMFIVEERGRDQSADIRNRAGSKG